MESIEIGFQKDLPPNQNIIMQKLERIWSNHYKKCVVICYWLFGLCNNFAYVVMLSAAHDILSKDETSNSTNNTTPIPFSNSSNNKYDCNEISTGAILLADILPGISIKLIAPFFIHHITYKKRVAFVVVVNIFSYLLVALSPSNYTGLIFLGVCCASLSSSFGEITFLSLSSFYSRSLSLTGWGSGTGAAGLIGSFGYAAMTSAGLAPKTVILMMVIVPIILIFAYIALPSSSFTKKYKDLMETEKSDNSDNENELNENHSNSNNSFKTRVFYGLEMVKPLGKFMLPLFVVYSAEYFINQGLFELLYFKNGPIKKHTDQYRWYNVIYQLAVFISRSSIRYIQFKHLSIFPILQVVNVGIALSQIYLGYMASIWLVFLLIFWEGLLGGGCYVNAFNRVSIEVPKKNREFAMGVVSIADGVGIAVAGFAAIPVHNAICEYGYK